MEDGFDQTFEPRSTTSREEASQQPGPSKPLGLCSACQSWLAQAINDRRNALSSQMLQSQAGAYTKVISDTHREYRLQEVMTNRDWCWLCSQICRPSSAGAPLDFMQSYCSLGFRQYGSNGPSENDEELWLHVPNHVHAAVMTVTRTKPSTAVNALVYRSNATSMASENGLTLDGNPPVQALLLESAPVGDYLSQAGFSSPEPQARQHVCRVERIKSWVQVCQAHGCRPLVDLPTGEKALPRRLLRLDLPEVYVRVVETSGLLQFMSSREIQYATLSHCWGKLPFLTLSKANYSSFLEAVPLDALEKTFQEAINLCKDLGVVFLWIDSLCIIQDSDAEVDWLEHARVMDAIYGNSVLNVAATSSENPKQGFWRPLRDVLLREIVIEIPMISREHGDRALYLHGEPHIASRQILANIFAASPLFGRAWCMQEVFLAPRTVHISEAQLQWQCWRHYCGEVFPYEPDTHGKYAMEDDAEFSSWRISDAFWLSVAQDFAPMQVTMARDRYWALAGLAAWFGRRYEACGITTEYWAGCWKHSICRDLLWAAESNTQGRRVSGPGFSLPTWSWLSTDGGIRYEAARRDLKYMMLVSKAEIALVNPDARYGPVSDARLFLQSPLCPLRQASGNLRNQRQATFIFGVYRTSWAQMYLTLPNGDVFRVDDHRDGVPEQLYLQMNFDDSSERADEVKPQQRWEIFLAPVAYLETEKRLEIYGLLLESVDEAVDVAESSARVPTYRRLGYFSSKEMHASYDSSDSDSDQDDDHDQDQADAASDPKKSVTARLLRALLASDSKSENYCLV